MVWSLALNAINFKFTLDALEDIWDKLIDAIDDYFTEIGEAVPSSVILQTYQGLALAINVALPTVTIPTIVGFRLYFERSGWEIKLDFEDLVPDFNIPGTQNLYFYRTDGGEEKVYQKGTEFATTQYYTFYNLLKDVAGVTLAIKAIQILRSVGLTGAIRHFASRILSNYKAAPTVLRNSNKLATLSTKVDTLSDKVDDVEIDTADIKSQMGTHATKSLVQLISSIELTLSNVDDDVGEEGELYELLRDVKNALGLRLSF